MSVMVAPSLFLEAQAGDEEWSDNESQARRQRHVLGQIHALYAPLVQSVMATRGVVSFTVSGKRVPGMHYGTRIATGMASELCCLAISEAIRSVTRTRRPFDVFTLEVFDGEPEKTAYDIYVR